MMLGLSLTIAELAARQSGWFLGPGARLPKLLPADGWTGVAGSGFTTVPADPVRTTAKPALRLVTAPNQQFTDKVLVGVQAFANDDGTLIGGIDRVRFHFEGRSIDVIAPHFHTFADSNGVQRTYWGYWIELRRGSINGTARLYVEAIPADATMQRRVIGPYTYFPAATAYSLSLEIAPTPAEIAGQRYKTLAAALNFLRTSNSGAALITYTESVTVEPFNTGAIIYAPAGGWNTITTAPGVTVTFASPSLNPANAQFRLRTNRLHFKGSGIVFDWRNVSEFRLETGHSYWLDGVRYINSDPAGPRALFAKAIRPVFHTMSQPCWYTELDCAYAFSAFPGAELVRGVKVEKAVCDFGNNAACVTGVSVVDGDNTTFFNVPPTAAMTVTYDPGPGNGNAATIQKTGGGTSDGVFTFKVDGTVVGTFTAVSLWTSFAGAQYNVSDLVNYINGPLKAIDPGFSATLIDNSRKASNLCRFGGNGKAIPETTITNTVLELDCEFDLHSDFIQFNDDSSFENHILSFNTVRKWGGQIIFFGKGTGTTLSDIAVINNVFLGNADGYLSQVGFRTMRHIMIAHNTWIDQVYSRGGTDALWDGYSLIANNTASGMTGTRQLETVKNNHVEVVGARLSSGSRISGGVNDTIGGTAATNFVNVAADDFRPAGALLANPKPPAHQFGDSIAASAATAAGAMPSN